jgi:hypothetical protein
MNYPASPLSSILCVDPLVQGQRRLTACAGQPSLRSSARSMPSDASIVSILPAVIGLTGKAFFRDQPACRIVLSYASDNYYYDKRKKASEKFAPVRMAAFPPLRHGQLAMKVCRTSGVGACLFWLPSPCRDSIASAAMMSAEVEGRKAHFGPHKSGTPHRPSSYAWSRCIRRSSTASGLPDGPAPRTGRSPDRSSRR